MAHDFIDNLRRRRSQYNIGRNVKLSQADITSIIQEAVRHAPSTFNSQSSRVAILYGSESVQFWDLVKAALRPLVSADVFEATEAKLKRFASGVGTVLFYEDQQVVHDLQETYKLYADKFPEFSEQSSGMAQFSVWTALANVGIGASLQHYNPVIDTLVAQQWDIPHNWKLRAQLPFGSNESEPGEKSFIDNTLRFKIAGNI
ncbi:nitroreductase family protein [Ochrobactrum sp. Marseille-Q0166]|uniref:nitroreductase family protein n=1 Tax=Ochrobactrum sp. Marseille-Q0166 TaxID=2761105 RepID=UPI00165518A9|nr:nitroreductase family protein [Ochrobactrum sp. Marseille-Q0166]MBC8719834.1 nitroreductase family protein [Ochrobactrum sp. Marseille-Q0166]